MPNSLFAVFASIALFNTKPFQNSILKFFFSSLIKAFTSNLTMTTELVDEVLISVSGATGLLMGPALLVFGSDSDVPVFLSKTYCSKKI